jgi:hypothetical protein
MQTEVWLKRRLVLAQLTASIGSAVLLFFVRVESPPGGLRSDSSAALPSFLPSDQRSTDHWSAFSLVFRGTGRFFLRLSVRPPCIDAPGGSVRAGSLRL